MYKLHVKIFEIVTLVMVNYVPFYTSTLKNSLRKLHELFQSVAMQKGTPKTSLKTIRIVIALCVLWARSGESAFFALLTEMVAKYMINKRKIYEKGRIIAP
ncbi:hypothetical protein [Lysinibacillus sp. K60]|uniref:hypothetical protein n=1 Tax=Lysinibacillus sp. K60 TaxID=2720027 RepID=UPI001C8CC153|nr:hypothetical protein [Lysinibacillus sp. K60]MBX8944005.1 hypothetical protein [Lysinibacillus sp. K60]